MTIVELMDDLADFIRPIVTEYSTEQPTVRREIKVYAGYPPIRLKPDESTSCVYVLVTSATDSDGENMSTANVEIGLSIYEAGEVEPWRALYNLAEHIRQHLLKHRLVAGRYRIKLPLKFEVPDAQPVPQWQARLTSEYSIAQPYEEDIIYEESY